MKKSPRQQQGVVIVMALFMVALIAAMAYVMLSRLERDTYRTRMILRNTQAESYAQGSVMWAIDQLRNNWIKQKTNHSIDVCPIESPENVMNGYHIKSIIYDMQAKFNLNNLIDVEAQQDFKHLLRIADPAISEDRAQKITNAVVDWIAPGSGENEFSRYYLKLPAPYRPAHRAMVSVSELNLVKDITPALYNAIKPYVCALPTATPVNVQSASLPVLTSLSNTMTLATSQTLFESRKQKPFTTVEAFLNLDVVKNHGILGEKVTVTSSYFLVETSVNIEKFHSVLYTLLERNAEEGEASVRIVWQSKQDA